MLSRREMMGVHGRWSTEEIKDGLVRCGRIEVRLVGLAAILHKAFGRKKVDKNTNVTIILRKYYNCNKNVKNKT